ncbi:EamA family transporter [Paenibacillus alginolyticus]|uniref:EamA family transporter n=1 Tax=Paenibacillus alginolyticus TaxID=59839 RepID=UPI0004925399|nr:EamA family transporter [Paenibacillus alginolyticus]MCY9664832.1 EamA family transporter [Paenibacillus alginolyticus]
MNYLLILLNVLLLVTGQTLWKIGVERFNFNNYKQLYLVLSSPFIITGCFLYVIATVIWILLLSRLPLSFLYPLQSLAYVVGLIIAIFVFHEHVTLTKWIGVGVILVGVYFVAK